MADYKKVSRGDSPFKSPAFTASWQNDVTDMLAWFRKAKASGEVLGAGGSLESSSGVVRVKNLTTADQLRGNYVQLGDYLLDDVSQHKHWYEGNLYDAAESGKIAILERAVKDDDTSMVRARILGKCTARVNVTDVDHRFAVPVDGESVFDSASSGDIEILGAIDGTGEQELPVLLGGGGGGGGGGALEHFILTQDCDSAVGNLVDGITTAHAEARRVTRAFESPDDVVISQREPESIVTVYNADPGKSYLSGQGVWCSSVGVEGIDGYYEIVSANCGVYPEGGE